MPAYHFDLDNIDGLYRLDSAGMLKMLAELPSQCRHAKSAPLPWEEKTLLAESIAKVVITGLGGSAIGGDILRVLTAGRMPVPVTVNRDYSLPHFVGPDTLVFAVSYSGNTEETLCAFEEARRRGAALVAVTTGGALAKAAQSCGVPVITVPGGLAPRAAVGYLFFPLLRTLEHLGFLPDAAAEMEEAAEVLKTMHEQSLGPHVPQEQNPAKQLARKLYGRLPVIWGSSGTTEVAAQRWKGQINENAKAPAYWNVFPELNHNEIVGFRFPASVLKNVHVVVLRDAGDHPRVQKRIEITAKVIDGAVDGITEVMSQGKGFLARIFSLIYTGDYTSVYLAALYGIDPGPVEVIDYLKRELGKNGAGS